MMISTCPLTTKVCSQGLPKPENPYFFKPETWVVRFGFSTFSVLCFMNRDHQMSFPSGNCELEQWIPTSAQLRNESSVSTKYHKSVTGYFSLLTKISVGILSKPVAAQITHGYQETHPSSTTHRYRSATKFYFILPAGRFSSSYCLQSMIPSRRSCQSKTAFRSTPQSHHHHLLIILYKLQPNRYVLPYLVEFDQYMQRLPLNVYTIHSFTV